MATHKHLYTGVLILFASLLSLHLLVFLFYIFSLSFQSYLSDHPVLNYYRSYAFSGPYFSKNNYIQATNKFYYQYKLKQGGWSRFRNLEEEHFLDYHKNYLKLHSLKASRLEKELAANLYYEFHVSDSAEFSHLKAMHNYLIIGDYFGGLSPDSVVMLYLKSTPKLNPSRRVQIDTLAYFRYTPLELEQY